MYNVALHRPYLQTAHLLHEALHEQQEYFTPTCI